MAGSLNKVTLIGNLGKDPEIRTLNSGDRVANFSIATSETWKDKQSGEKKEKTEWHNVVVFGDGLVGVIEKYVSKGSKVYVQGALQTRKWQDQQGQDRYSTEIVLKPFNGDLILLSSANGGDGGGQRDQGGQQQGNGGGNRQQNSQQTQRQQTRAADLDDEIPF